VVAVSLYLFLNKKHVHYYPIHYTTHFTKIAVLYLLPTRKDSSTV
jgi:hypothetical protein